MSSSLECEERTQAKVGNLHQSCYYAKMLLVVQTERTINCDVKDAQKDVQVRLKKTCSLTRTEKDVHRHFFLARPGPESSALDSD